MRCSTISAIGVGSAICSPRSPTQKATGCPRAASGLELPARSRSPGGTTATRTSARRSSQQHRSSSQRSRRLMPDSRRSIGCITRHWTITSGGTWTTLQRRAWSPMLSSTPYRENTSDRRDWAAADPYVSTHLATHADHVGRLGRTTGRPRVPRRCRLRAPPAPTATRSFWRRWRVGDHHGARASPRLRGGRIEERPSYLELAARQFGADNLADRIAAHFPDRPWTLPVALWRRPGRHVPLTGHERLVTALALGLIEDRTAAVSAGDDGTVRLWDLEARAQIGEPLAGHEKLRPPPSRLGRSARSAVERSRSAVATTGPSGYGTWRARTQIGEPLTGHEDWVRAVAFGKLGDRVVAFSGGSDGTVRLWDLEAQPPYVGEPLSGHAGSVARRRDMPGPYARPPGGRCQRGE